MEYVIRETTELKDKKHHSEPLLCFCWALLSCGTVSIYVI